MTDTPEPIDTESDLRRIRRHVDQLAPFFDTVQVLCTKFDPSTGETHSFKTGHGNWFARRGQASDWLDETQSEEDDEDDD